MTKSPTITPLTQKQLTNLSKFLSLILRHKPETVNLSLDSEGYVDISQLISNINSQSDYNITRSTLDHIVTTDSKQRYSYNKTKTKIRANQGHSIPVDLNLTAQIPPEILYHGTAQHSVPYIFASGLKPMSRQYVHLSTSPDIAIKVGKRHCYDGEKPVVFIINAAQMYKDNFEFFLSENGVWLTKRIPKKYLTNNRIILEDNLSFDQSSYHTYKSEFID